MGTIKGAIVALTAQRSLLHEERKGVVEKIDEIEVWFKNNNKYARQDWRMKEARRSQVEKKDELIKRAKEINSQIKTINNNIVSLEDEKSIEEKGADAVSDHALIKYMERVHGINFSKLRKKIVEEVIAGSVSNTVNTKGSLYVAI